MITLLEKFIVKMQVKTIKLDNKNDIRKKNYLCNCISDLKLNRCKIFYLNFIYSIKMKVTIDNYQYNYSIKIYINFPIKEF